MSNWRASEVLAWTTHDGPGRPPRAASPLLLAAVAGGLVVAYVGMMFTDALCPEHRAWVDGLAGMSTILAGAAVVGLVRGWAGGAPLAVAATLGGVVIGLIDAVHDPGRGRVIALVFAALAVAALAIAATASRSRRWVRSSTSTGHDAVAAQVPLAQPTTDAAPASASEPEPHEAVPAER